MFAFFCDQGWFTTRELISKFTTKDQDARQGQYYQVYHVRMAIRREPGLRQVFEEKERIHRTTTPSYRRFMSGEYKINNRREDHV